MINKFNAQGSGYESECVERSWSVLPITVPPCPQVHKMALSIRKPIIICF